MEVSWTAQQQKVIDLRNRNILVSAAAGSGKTAVLVERIIKMITDRQHPIDIDRLLIVTFTNAAAAEMRERIANAIEKALEESAGDEHLLRQLTLIHNAQITTIDSFCLYIVRNHFHEIDLEPNFRIADEGELKLLKEDVLKKMLEQNYERQTKEFTQFVEGYAAGRTDAALNAMILQLYEFSRSYPWPEKWLDACADTIYAKDESCFNEAVWIMPLTKNLKLIAEDMVHFMEQALCLTQASDGPAMYEKAVRSDLEKYQKIASLDTFTQFLDAFTTIKYERLASSRGFDGDLEKLELVKQLREQAKDVVKKVCKQYFFCPLDVLLEQLRRTEPMIKEVVRLIKQFAEQFAAAKRAKNLVDFHDMEHFALNILVDSKTEKAKKTAEEFRDTFEEIMIDEYQDSNEVQEALLCSISRQERGQNNLFMVGDVKQSIYRFRLARPELFMKKYDEYSSDDSDRQRIDLHKNFRSRKEVLDFTNDIFYKIMKRSLGNVEYDKNAALYTGAVYPESDDFAPEILLADSQDELLSDMQLPEKKALEAKMTAEKIKKLKKTQLVTDKKTGQLRPVKYSDIVILLRSLSGWADQFMSVLNENGIPAHTISSTGYFSAAEVQTVLSMLTLLDNPRQDIPMAAVLRSPIAGFSDEELADLRVFNKNVPFHAAVLELAETLRTKEKDETLSAAEQKLSLFYEKYIFLRQLVPDTPIRELIEILLKKTGYGNYVAAMPAGSRRRANLNMLLEKAAAYEKTSYKGLFHFVRYIEQLQKYDVDFGEADMVGENEDVVRIMSIHKSKGLEFPIVFVCGMGKNFNKQDTKSKMVLHSELGIGLDYMDGTRRIKSQTILKKAIAKQIDLENLGEELRVLYVALTRAKEKLILTGSLKDASQKLEKYKNQAVFAADQELPYLFRESAASYLDWVIPAVLSYGEKYSIQLVDAAELVIEEIETQTDLAEDFQKRIKEIENADKKLLNKLEEKFSQVYPYETDIVRKNKYSVSEIKSRAMSRIFEQEQTESVPLFVSDEIVSTVPHFLQQEERKEEPMRAIGALRGTAVHRMMQCYDFSAESTAAEQLRLMQQDGRISAEWAQLITIEIIETFADSAIGKRMAAAQKAGKLYREKPFVMGVTEAQLKQYGFDELDETKSREEDLTLIQGIIDVFWIEEDGIVLLDYKTDRVQTKEQLVQRYEMQMKLYAQALERVFAPHNLKVKEMFLYSFKFRQVLQVI